MMTSEVKRAPRTPLQRSMSSRAYSRTLPRTDSRGSISSVRSTATAFGSARKHHTMKPGNFRYDPNRGGLGTPQSRLSTCSSASSMFRRGGSSSKLWQGEAPTVKVMVRIRPSGSEDEQNKCIEVLSAEDTDSDRESRQSGRSEELLASLKRATIRVAGASGQSFTFDRVFGSEEKQETVFLDAGKPIAESALAGYNASIFAYGQTGSGKTYTMQGALDNESQRGLIPRVLEQVFMGIDKLKQDGVQVVVHCSFLEIYNEQVYDLLDNPTAYQMSQPGYCQSSKPIREDIKRGVFVAGAVEESIASAKEASVLITRGTNNRHVASTQMNRESSRSHSIFTLTLQIKTPANETTGTLETTRSSRINLVDLAGSERQTATRATGDRLNEAKHINKSLSALGNVISALVERSKGRNIHHVPHRDSKLTNLLRESLGGNTKTSIIATISPESANLQDTISTLQFGQRAKNIKQMVRANTQMCKDVSKLQQEIKRLRQELETLKTQPADITAKLASASDAPATDENDASRANLQTEWTAQLKANPDFVRIEATAISPPTAGPNAADEKSALAILRQRIAHTECVMVGLLKELKGTRNHFDDLQNINRATKEEVAVLRDELDTERILKEAINAKHPELNLQDITAKIEMQQEIEAQSKMTTLVRKNRELMARLQELEDRGFTEESLNQQRRGLDALHKQLEAVLEDKKSLEDVVAKLQAKIKVLQSQSAELEDNLFKKKDLDEDLAMGQQAELMDALAAKTRELAHAQTHIEELEQQLFDLTEAKIDTQSGAFPAKKIKQARRHSIGVHRPKALMPLDQPPSPGRSDSDNNKLLFGPEKMINLSSPTAPARAVLMVAAEAQRSARKHRLAPPVFAIDKVESDPCTSSSPSPSTHADDQVPDLMSPSVLVSPSARSAASSAVQDAAELMVAQKFQRQLQETKRQLREAEQANRRLSVQLEKKEESARKQKATLRKSLSAKEADADAGYIKAINLELEVAGIREKYERAVCNNKQLNEAVSSLRTIHEFEKKQYEATIAKLNEQVALACTQPKTEMPQSSTCSEANSDCNKSDSKPGSTEEKEKAPPQEPETSTQEEPAIEENRTSILSQSSRVSSSGAQRKKAAPVSVAAFFPEPDSESSKAARTRVETGQDSTEPKNTKETTRKSIRRRKSSLSSVSSSLSSVKVPFRILGRFTSSNKATSNK